MPQIEILETGLLYANPMPHLRSRQATFPTVAPLDDGSLLAAFTVGEAFESADGHTELARSADGGRTWTHLGPMPRTPTPHPTSESGRLSRTPDGELLCFGPRFDRSDPERPIGNAATNGFLDCEAVLYRSRDGGASWSDAEVLPIPLPAPYEIASSIVVLPDGRWLAPFATWRNWEGVKQTPERAYGLVSHDRGRTWPGLLTTFDDPKERCVFWEQRLLSVGEGRLLAVAWTHDHEAGRDLPDHFALARDGEQFGPPRSTGLAGQTCTPLWLGGDRLLCLYNHRYGEPGVRAALVRFSETEWRVETESVVWGQGGGPRQRGATVVAELNQLRFGFPGAVPLPDGSFLATHWCMEDAQLVIRWTRLAAE